MVCAGLAWPAATAPTARQIVEQIQHKIGVSLPANTVDTFKAGNPDTPVTGIAVTMMATYDVLERAAAAGANFVITHEPTFYNHQDSTGPLEQQHDAVLAAKQEFIARHKLVVWRFHDGWHARQPDGILEGMVKAIGWTKFQNAQTPNLFVIPQTTVNDLGAQLASKLHVRVLRLVGDPGLRVTQAAMLPGAAGSSRHIKTLERPDVQALIIGEAPEWETVEYVDDAAAQGKSKALLILGHIPSAQAGMDNCAEWLRSFISGIPIKFIPAKEPFHQPGLGHNGRE